MVVAIAADRVPVILIDSFEELERRQFRSGGAFSRKATMDNVAIHVPISIIDNIPLGVIRFSQIHGLGLFADDDLKPGTVLAHLDGQQVLFSTYESATGISKDGFDEWNAISKSILLYRPFRTKYSYINHSRAPNCVVKIGDGVRLFVATTMAIPRGSELLLDYREEALPDGYLFGHGASYL